jgi:predicted transcriptional regulator
VTTGLEAASEAYQAALGRVTDALAEVAAARAAVPEVRARLADAIVTAYRSGMRVGEIARISGYGREQVRRILRRAGVEPD